MLFMLQRLVFAFTIVFVKSIIASQHAFFLLVLMSLAVLIFTLIERPWKEERVNILAIVNEACVYLILITLLALSSISYDSN